MEISAEEGLLSDQKWGKIVQDFVREMGFTDESGKAPCAWVAVLHGLSQNGNDHIHLAVSWVREDGSKVNTHIDFEFVQAAVRWLEQEYGLIRLNAERAQRAGRSMADRVTLERTVRSCVGASSNEAEFVRRPGRAGLLVKPRNRAGHENILAG